MSVADDVVAEAGNDPAAILESAIDSASDVIDTQYMQTKFVFEDNSYLIFDRDGAMIAQARVAHCRTSML